MAASFSDAIMTRGISLRVLTWMLGVSGGISSGLSRFSGTRSLNWIPLLMRSAIWLSRWSSPLPLMLMPHAYSSASRNICALLLTLAMGSWRSWVSLSSLILFRNWGGRLVASWVLK